MPTYVVTAPDGKRYRVTAPEGATDAQVRAMVERQSAPAQKPTSFWQGVAEGIQKPGTNTIRALEKLNPIIAAGQALGLPSAADAIDRKAEVLKARSPNRGSTLGRIAGGVIGTAPTMALPGGPALQGAAAGALMSEDAEDPRTLARDAAIGGAFGYAGGKVGEKLAKGAGRLIGGRKATPPALPKAPAKAAYRKAVQTLSDQDVLLTPGRRAGGVMRRLEDAADSFPLSPTRAAKEGSLVDFNRAAYNQVLEPLKIKVNRNVAPGRDAIVAIDDTVNAAYNNAAAGLQLQLDDQLMRRLASYADNAEALMGPDDAAQLGANIRNVLQWRSRPAPLNGKEVSGALADMRKVASSARAQGKQTLADTLWSMHDDLETAAMAQSPKGVVAGFKSAREAMRRLHTLDKAVEKGKDGLFTPNQFKTATHARGYGVTNKRLARGEAPMQTLADAAALVLPDSIGNSGTAERAGVMSLLSGGGLFGTSGLLGAPLPAAAALASPAAAYIPAVNRFAQYGRNLSPGALNAGRAIASQAPRAGRAGASLAAAAGLYPFLSEEERKKLF